MTTGSDHHPLIDEQLSAWLDDELPRVEREMLVNRLLGSPEHQARVARYSLIGSSLRGARGDNSQGELAALRLASRVQVALEETEGVSRPEMAGGAGRLLPYAVAAAVALVAVGIALVQGSLRQPAGNTSVAGLMPGKSATEVVGQPPATLVRAGAGSQPPLSPQRLTSYLLSHGKYSGTLSARITESHIVNYSPPAVALRTVDRLPTQ